jgi:hypothetical protein
MNSAHKSRLTIPSCRFVTTVDLGRKGAETRQSNIAHYGPTHAHAYDYSKSISSCCYAIRGTLINSDAQIRRAISAPTAAAAVGGPIVGTLLTLPRLCMPGAVHPVLVRREPQQFAVGHQPPLHCDTKNRLARIRREQRHVAIGSGREAVGFSLSLSLRLGSGQSWQANPYARLLVSV